MSVAVCAKPSVFIKRMLLPTATVVVAGEYPPPVPAAVCEGGFCVRFTVMVVTPDPPEEPESASLRRACTLQTPAVKSVPRASL